MGGSSPNPDTSTQFSPARVPQRVLLFELPRMGLSFELRDDGVLHSMDHQDCVLARQQQLVYIDEAMPRGMQYTLPGFTQYLVLERDSCKQYIPNTSKASSRRIIVLEGLVYSVGESNAVPCAIVLPAYQRPYTSAMVQVDRASGADIKVYCYDVHGRFGDIRTASIPARMQLAALYAATGTMVPEPLSGKTGGQMALHLLRQCWKSAPLTDTEAGQLAQVARLGRCLTPALPLMVYELQQSACQLTFLPSKNQAESNHAADSTTCKRAAQQRQKQVKNLKQREPVLSADVTIPYHALCGGSSSSTAIGSSTGGSSGSSMRGACGTDASEWGPNPHGLLTPCEEVRVLGMHVHAAAATEQLPLWHRDMLASGVGMMHGIPALPITAQDVTELEEQPSRMCFSVSSNHGELQYPLLAPLQQSTAASSSTSAGPDASAGMPVTHGSGPHGPGEKQMLPLEWAMHAELEASWQEFHGSRVLWSLNKPREETCRALAEQKDRVKYKRNELQHYLLQHANPAPVRITCLHEASFRLACIAQILPQMTVQDLLRITDKAKESGFAAFNPFLSSSVCQQLYAGMLLWLRLCVLEDRLGRAVAFAQAGQEHEDLLLQELRIVREWDVCVHPAWLAFEAEQQLQIRPLQYKVALQLMANPGAISQLNMGEGKTRVILPMLLLHWAKGQTLVRINLLSTLLDEAYGYLHSVLCASALSRKLLSLPFHRDVDLTPQRAAAMHAALAHIMQEGGVLLMAPEHRLSLHLKEHELRLQHQQLQTHHRQYRTGINDGDKLAAIIAGLAHLQQLPYLDILDEVDELLHHRLRLIYACGTAIALPQCHERACASAALLRVLSHMADVYVYAHNAVQSDGVAVWEGVDARCPGAYSGVRLLPGDQLHAEAAALSQQLADALLAAPPHELRWLRPEGRDHPCQVELRACMLDASQSAKACVCGQARACLQEDQWHALLALRGLLAGGLLLHCLQLRHGVQYGISRSPTFRKRLAVPYRAAHTPAERSEYSQPDVALVLTSLSYYADGLSQQELNEALAKLLSMGPNAQEDHWREWLGLSRPAMPAEAVTSMDSAAKLDLTNAAQMDTLWHYFSHNMAAIDFWLLYCVFPTETQQYPERLACSAWDLAANARGWVVGFSGTNDSHRLLPTQVTQVQADVSELKATNGKMLSLILANTRYCTLAAEVSDGSGNQEGIAQVPSGLGAMPAAYMALLDHALACGAHALLD